MNSWVMLQNALHCVPRKSPSTRRIAEFLMIFKNCQETIIQFSLYFRIPNLSSATYSHTSPLKQNLPGQSNQLNLRLKRNWAIFIGQLQKSYISRLTPKKKISMVTAFCQIPIANCCYSPIFCPMRMTLFTQQTALYPCTYLKIIAVLIIKEDEMAAIFITVL